jgi:hypothetical protein
MAVELVNPDGLPKPEVYRQLSIATGSRLVFLAGQVARLVPARTALVSGHCAQHQQGGRRGDAESIRHRQGVEYERNPARYRWRGS